MRNSLLAAAILCTLIFNPIHGTVKAAMTVIGEEQPDEEIQPPRHAQLPGAERPPDGQEPAAKTATALVAGNLVGVVFFFVGIVGWILLGVTTWILERRRPVTPS